MPMLVHIDTSYGYANASVSVSEINPYSHPCSSVMSMKLAIGALVNDPVQLEFDLQEGVCFPIRLCRLGRVLHGAILHEDQLLAISQLPLHQYVLAF